jgi:CheY-like chemotaxis protein
VAGDGKEALQKLSVTPFDIIFMDCHMPGMDGYETTAEIRALPGPAARIPIVGLTARAMAGDRERCLAAGMTDYFPKPIQLEDLQLALQRASLASGGDEPAQALSAGMRGRMAELRRDLPAGVLTALVEAFHDQISHEIDEMDGARARQDLAAVTSLAHSLAGCALDFGAQTLADLCRLAEHAARTGSIHELDPLLPRLREEARIVRAQLRPE